MWGGDAGQATAEEGGEGNFTPNSEEEQAIKSGSRMTSKPKVAIVHDCLSRYGGPERVLEQILHIFPDADLFSMVDLIPEERRGFLMNKPVQTSFIQKLPKWARQRHLAFLPLMPCLVEQFDLSGYDLVISSGYSVAKGVITGPNQLHIAYCHSPLRYAWDLRSHYLKGANLHTGVRGLIAKILLHYFRIWDAQSQQRVDHFVTNSQFVRRRIEKVYRREAEVVHPPVDVKRFTCQPVKDEHYLVAGHMVAYKKIGVVVDAFARMPNRHLRVIGDGPEFEGIRRRATPNVRMLGYTSNAVLRDEMQSARAFVFAGEEDFGILPLEAQACGTPVIAYSRGGLKESVDPKKTGIFFHEQTPAAICAAVDQFEAKAISFNPREIRKHAERFSAEKFREGFLLLVSRHWREFTGGGELETNAKKPADSVFVDRFLPNPDELVSALR